MMGVSLLSVHCSSVNGPLQPPALVNSDRTGSMTDVAGSGSRLRLYVPAKVGVKVNHTFRLPPQLDVSLAAVVALNVSMLVTYGREAGGTTMAVEQTSLGGTTGRVTRSCT